MKTINDFKFQINISVDSYKDKVEAQDCVATRELARKHGKEKMAFKEQTVTVSEFIQYAISGHSFCNLFNVQPDKLYPITVKGQTFYTSAFYKKGKNAGAMKLSFKSDEYYRGQQVIFVDIDLTKFKTIEDYLDTLTYQPTCTYTSFSDNKMKGGIISRRFRMVYVFAFSTVVSETSDARSLSFSNFSFIKIPFQIYTFFVISTKKEQSS